ncbi:MAG: hypothetical protein VYD19_09105 [Myxococcota bacterium]|nr:hypothetical protein [Myxococcota bacterium]
MANGECYLDNKLIARLPMPGPWTLPVGRYQLELRDGSWRSKRAIEIQAGKRLTLDLRRIPAGMAGVEEKGPVEIRYAPPPFPLYETSYGLLGIAALTLGLAAYFHFDAIQIAEEARSFGRDQRRSDQDFLVNEAESQLARARVSYGLSVTTLIGGLSYLLFSKEGLLKQQDGPPPGLFEQSGG